MSATQSSTRLMRLAFAALTVLACLATALPAQTARKKADDKAKQKPAAVGASQTVKLEEHGVQYRLPARWQQGQTSTPNVVSMAALFDPKSKGPPPTWMMVRVLPVGADATLDSVLAGVAKTFNCCGPHYKAVFGKDVTLAGEIARTVVLEPQEERVKEQKVFLTGAQHGERAYVFTFVTKPDHYAKVLPDADKLLKSVKWLGPEIPPTEVAERKAGELLVDAPATPAAPAKSAAATPVAPPPPPPPPLAPQTPRASPGALPGEAPPPGLAARQARYGLTVFYSPEGDFSLEHPSLWQMRKKAPAPQAKLMIYPRLMDNAPGNLAEHFVVVVDEPAAPAEAKDAGDAERTGKAVAEQLIEQYKSGDPEAEVVSQADVKIDGVPAHRVTMVVASSGFATKRSFVCAVRNGKSYTFSYSADPAEFDQWASMTNAIVDSVQWGKPTPPASGAPEPTAGKPAAAKPAGAKLPAAVEGDGLD